MNPDIHLASLAMYTDHYSIPSLEWDGEEKPKRLNNCNWILIHLLASLGGFAAYSYAPCLPSITSEFGAEQFATSVALVSNWVSRGIGSFLFGYLSDYTGRKWMIFIGLQFIVLGSFFCSESRDIFEFILTIIIQGIGEGAASLVFPVIAETYCISGDEKWRHQGIVSSIQNFSLAIGPAIGGLITGSNGWRWVFRIIYIWAIVCMIFTCFLPETNQREERRKTMYQICDRFWHQLIQELSVLCRREYISGLLFFCLYNAIIYIFLSTLGFVFEDFYGMTALESGLLISAIAGGALFGTIVSVWGLGEKNAPAMTHLSDLRWAFCFVGFPVLVGSWIAVGSQVYVHSDNNGWIVATVIAIMMFFLNSVTLSYTAIQHQRFQDKYGTSIGFSAMITLAIALIVALPVISLYNDKPELIMQSITIVFSCLWVCFWITMGIPGLPSGYWDDSDCKWKGDTVTSEGKGVNLVQNISTHPARRTY